MSEFLFKIGDEVMHRAGIADAMISCRMGALRTPNIGIIIERVSQECPGGVQHHYTVGFGAREPVRVNEVELVATSAFDVEAALTTFIEASTKYPLKRAAQAADTER